MRILLTNDDGFRAPGLQALYDALSTVAEVTVVAPKSQQSAISMAITLTDILRVNEIQDGNMKGYYVNGTPADCVKIGCSELLKEKPDYIFSGINLGSNVGLNANYSGTVAGAVEGTMMGIPSVAMSLASVNSIDYRGSCISALKVLELLQDNPLNRYELLNVNVPAIPPDEIKGMRVAKVSHSSFREVFDLRMDARNREYYWMGGVWHDFDEVENGDRQWNEEGYVAITPLKVDWTAEETFEKMRKSGWDIDWS